ncbi:phage regulatory protein CII [Pseudacidovorax intermedius]|uniref:Phage regulatory protein CII n=1 Tax=Pseudacidovorax intermedius TaxID=433924 RepID=A0A370FG51_9BURK|nr:phage regulatory CII family protein [Pseudacidovorax intermedius]RDI25190.1 phage regulatory protein CII [Pseudacidovorax intermedius]
MRSHRTDIDAVPDSPHEAFRVVVHSYGVKDMAAQMLCKPGTLYNKCDSDEDGRHQPTLRDLVQVTRISGDMRILESLNRLFDRACFDASTEGVSYSDAAILELLCEVSSEKGHLFQALRDGLSDGKWSADDMRAVRKEAFDLFRAVQVLMLRLQGMVDA